MDSAVKKTLMLRAVGLHDENQQRYNSRGMETDGTTSTHLRPTPHAGKKGTRTHMRKASKTNIQVGDLVLLSFEKNMAKDSQDARNFRTTKKSNVRKYGQKHYEQVGGAPRK